MERTEQACRPIEKREYLAGKQRASTACTKTRFKRRAIRDSCRLYLIEETVNLSSNPFVADAADFWRQVSPIFAADRITM
jgi:hypothetical protein